VGTRGWTKLTPLVRQRLLEAIERGLTFTLACQTCAISMDSLARWRAKDAAFAAEIREAEGRSADRWLGLVEAAAPKNWLAAAWLLERRHPHEYGRHLVFDRGQGAYDEPMLRQLAQERGIDPDEFVAAVTRVQLAAAARTPERGASAPIPLYARGTRFGPGIS
jgi:hypothetical protein